MDLRDNLGHKLLLKLLFLEKCEFSWHIHEEHPGDLVPDSCFTRQRELFGQRAFQFFIKKVWTLFRFKLCLMAQYQEPWAYADLQLTYCTMS